MSKALEPQKEPPKDPIEPPRDPDKPPMDPGEQPKDAGKPLEDPDEPPRDPGEPPKDPGEPPKDLNEPPKEPSVRQQASSSFVVNSGEGVNFKDARLDYSTSRREVKISNLFVGSDKGLNFKELLGLDADDTRSSEGTTPTDPTRPLPPPPARRFPTDDVCVKRWSQRLTDNRLLLLSGFEWRALTVAGFSIAYESKFPGLKRSLEFLTRSHDDCVGFSGLLEDAVAQGEPCIILVDVRSKDAVSFIESMTDQPTAVEGIKVTLSERQRFIILLGTDETLPSSECYDDLRDQLDLHTVMKYHFPDDHDEYYQQLVEQRHRGLWNQDDREFYQELKQAMRAGNLAREIDRRGQPDCAQPTPDPGVATEVLACQDELAVSVLFVATFYKNLPVQDFNRVLSRILTDRTRKETKPSYMMNENGEAWSTEEVSEQLLIDIWQEDHQSILKKCHLAFMQPLDNMTVAQPLDQGTEEPVVEFTESGLREQMRQAFWTSWYITFIDLFQRIYSRAVLFDPSTSVRDGTIELMKEIARTKPERYGEGWLIDLILNADPGRTQTITAEDSEQGLLQIIRVIQSKGLFYDRLEHLIRAMLADARLREGVDLFFDKLVSMNLYDQVTHLVGRLRFAREFDPYRWWKNLLDKADGEIYTRVCNAILKTAYTDSSQLAEATRNLELWLRNAPADTADRSTRAASHLMIDLCLNMTFRKHEKVRSSWPPRNKVLAAFAESSRENLEEKILQGIAHRQNRDYLGENWPRHLGLLISSRLFPDRNGFILSEDAEELHQDLAIEWITALYRSRDDERVPCQGEFFPYLLESIVVADWAMELLGFPDEVPESAEELFQSITKAMGKHLDREGRRRIRDYWSALVNCQLEVMAALNRAKPSIPKGELEDFANLRHQLKRERKIVRRLSKEC